MNYDNLLNISLLGTNRRVSMLLQRGETGVRAPSRLGDHKPSRLLHLFCIKSTNIKKNTTMLTCFTTNVVLSCYRWCYGKTSEMPPDAIPCWATWGLQYQFLSSYLLEVVPFYHLSAAAGSPQVILYW